MDLKKLEEVKADLNKTHTQYEWKAAILKLIDILEEHFQENDVEFEKLEEEENAVGKGKK